MYPGTYAAEAPDRIAAVMAGTGETVSYGELERRSAQLAHVLHDAGPCASLITCRAAKQAS